MLAIKYQEPLSSSGVGVAELAQRLIRIRQIVFYIFIKPISYKAAAVLQCIRTCLISSRKRIIMWMTEVVTRVFASTVDSS